MSEAGKVSGGHGHGHAHQVKRLDDHNKREDKEVKEDKSNDLATEEKPSDKGVPDFRDDWRRYELNDKYNWGHQENGEHGHDDEHGHKGDKKKEAELAQLAAEQAALEAQQEAARQEAARQEQIAQQQIETQVQEDVRQAETIEYDTHQYEQKSDAKQYDNKQYEQKQVALNEEKRVALSKRGEGMSGTNRFNSLTDEIEVSRERFQQGKPPEGVG